MICFHGSLDTHSTLAKQIMELPDKYVKYITKGKDEDICNYLQWWRNHQSTYTNSQMAFDLFAIPALSSEFDDVSELLAKLVIQYLLVVGICQVTYVK